MKRVYAYVFIISLGTIALEIVLTRIISVMMWYHFSYLVISVALLGFGVAGTRLAVSSRLQGKAGPALMARYALWFSLAAVAAPLMVGQIRLFNLLDFGARPFMVLVFGIYYLLLMAPFYFAGMALAMALQHYRASFGRVYAIDLIGAGAGGLLAVFSLDVLSAPGVLVLIGLLALGASFCVSASPSRGWRVFGGCWLSVLIIALGFLETTTPTLFKTPAIKAINQMTFNRQADFKKWNALCRVDVSPELSFSPWFGADISPGFLNRFYPMRIIFQDGTAPTPMYRDAASLPDFPFLQHCTPAGLYLLYTQPEVLVIGPGGGVDVMVALQAGAKHVTAVELNPVIYDIVSARYDDYLGGLYHNTAVELVNAEGRNYLGGSNRQFDVIQLTCIDTFTAMSIGAYCLSENYLYTVEAVTTMLDHLRPEGLLMYARHHFSPPRESLRLVAIIVEALARQGVKQPEEYLFIYGLAGSTVLVKKSGFTREEAARLERFCDTEGFRIYHHPYKTTTDLMSGYIMGTPMERKTFAANYQYNVTPSTDDSPFFFQYYKWSHLLGFTPGAGPWRLKYPVSNLVLLISLAQAVLMSVVLIIWPLRRLKSRQPALPAGFWTAVISYFACLGTAYMVIEVVLIQKLTVFLGYPLRSMTVVLLVLLIASGAGSAMAEKYFGKKTLRAAGFAILGIAGFMICGWIFSAHAVQSLIGYCLTARVMMTAAVIFPLGFCMGMPLPLGIGLLTRDAPRMIPWAWGINACFSVIGSLIAVVISMRVGFTLTALSAVIVYGVGFLALAAASRFVIPASCAERNVSRDPV